MRHSDVGVFTQCEKDILHSNQYDGIGLAILWRIGYNSMRRVGSVWAMSKSLRRNGAQWSAIEEVEMVVDVAKMPELFPGEEINSSEEFASSDQKFTDSEINEKYVRGHVRIVTEQARYPISSITAIVEDTQSYTMSPDYQRRHRWPNIKKSKLIESLIMNVPIPPIFLYEYDYSKYEVMDGLQRLTAIYEFYRNRFALEGLTEWSELNNRSYDELPEKVKEGIDRRYLSSVILLKETARDEKEALILKKLVFERINSGGVTLSSQESRNALLDGPMNRLCIKLSRNESLCALWDIPITEKKDGTPSTERAKNDYYRHMIDVELVLRFFAYRQKHNLHKSGVPLSVYFDTYLRYGNKFSKKTLEQLEDIFCSTIKFAEDLLGTKCFQLYREYKRGRKSYWIWRQSPSITVYDPLMLVLSELLEYRKTLVRKAKQIQNGMENFYKDNPDAFAGRDVNRSDFLKREGLYRNFFKEYLK